MVIKKKNKNKKIKMEVCLTKENYQKLKRYSNEKIGEIINESVRIYFDKEFCIREAERNALLRIGLLDK